MSNLPAPKPYPGTPRPNPAPPANSDAHPEPVLDSANATEPIEARVRRKIADELAGKTVAYTELENTVIRSMLGAEIAAERVAAEMQAAGTLKPSDIRSASPTANVAHNPLYTPRTWAIRIGPDGKPEANQRRPEPTPYPGREAYPDVDVASLADEAVSARFLKERENFRVIVERPDQSLVIVLPQYNVPPDATRLMRLLIELDAVTLALRNVMFRIDQMVPSDEVKAASFKPQLEGLTRYRAEVLAAFAKTEFARHIAAAFSGKAVTP